MSSYWTSERLYHYLHEMHANFHNLYPSDDRIKNLCSRFAQKRSWFWFVSPSDMNQFFIETKFYKSDEYFELIHRETDADMDQIKRIAPTLTLQMAVCNYLFHVFRKGLHCRLEQIDFFEGCLNLVTVDDMKNYCLLKMEHQFLMAIIHPESDLRRPKWAIDFLLDLKSFIVFGWIDSLEASSKNQPRYKDQSEINQDEERLALLNELNQLWNKSFITIDEKTGEPVVNEKGRVGYWLDFNSFRERLWFKTDKADAGPLRKDHYQIIQKFINP